MTLKGNQERSLNKEGDIRVSRENQEGWLVSMPLNNKDTQGSVHKSERGITGPL